MDLSRYPALAAGGSWGAVSSAFAEGAPPVDAVAAVTVVPFAGDRCVLARMHGGALTVPGGTIEPGEHWVNAALRELVEEAGARAQSLHPFGVFRCRSAAAEPYRPHLPHPALTRVVAWADVAVTSTPANPPEGQNVEEVLVLPVDEAVGRLLGAGSREFAELCRLAHDLRADGVDDDRWYRDNTRLLEQVYLAADDPYGQSGKSGDAADWELGRRVITRAIDRAGAFLDVGCANGLLMESVAAWTADRGHAVEPYGVDISAPLIELARSRLPGWRDRLWVGNAADWSPPRRFDFVHTLLELVPDHRRRQLVGRLLDEAVVPGGRLIVSQYLSVRNGDADAEPVGELLRRWGFTVAGLASEPRGGRGPTHVAWIEAPS